VLWQIGHVGQPFLSNYFVLFDSLKLGLVLMLSFFWPTQRSDIAMAIFVLLSMGSNVMGFWNESYPWNWSDWKGEYWFSFVSYAFETALFVLASFALRCSANTFESSYPQLVWIHSSFGLLFSAAAAIGLEVVPNWELFKGVWKLLDLTMSWQLLLLMAFPIAFMAGLVALARWSDLLTTAFTVQLAFLLLFTGPFFSALRLAPVPIDFIKLNPLLTAGVALALVILIYWFVRIFTLKCCWRWKFDKPGNSEYEDLIDETGTSHPL